MTLQGMKVAVRGHVENIERQAGITRVEPSTRSQTREHRIGEGTYRHRATAAGIESVTTNAIIEIAEIAANTVKSKYTDRLAFVKSWVEATGENLLPVHTISVSTSQQSKRSGMAFANNHTYRAKRVARIDSRETTRRLGAERCIGE